MFQMEGIWNGFALILLLKRRQPELPNYFGIREIRDLEGSGSAALEFLHIEDRSGTP